jgi:hypothetical protein
VLYQFELLACKVIGGIFYTTDNRKSLLKNEWGDNRSNRAVYFYIDMQRWGIFSTVLTSSAVFIACAFRMSKWTALSERSRSANPGGFL